LPLRSNVEQPVFLHVSNPGEAERRFIVRVLAGEKGPEIVSAKLAVPARKTEPVRFVPAPPPPAAAAPPPGAVAAATGTELAGPPFRLWFALVDEAQDQELSKQEVALEIVPPHQYVDVTRMQYTSSPGRGNRLEVAVQAKKGFEPPASRVELVLKPDRIPGLASDKPESGTLQSSLREPGQQVRLYAENLSFAADAVEGNGLVHLTVDGYERAFTYETTFLQREGTVTPRPILAPVLRLNARRFAAPGAFPIRLEVDNAPRSEVIVEVGLDRDNDGQLAEEELRKLVGPRQQRVTVAAESAGGLRFKTEVRDWALSLDAAGLLGERVLQARLLGPGGQELEAAQVRVRFDATPPVEVALTSPAKLPREATIPVKAVGADPDSGIAEVHFFAGKPPSEGKPLPDGAVKGVPPAPGQKEWSAKLPVTAGQRGPVEISVLFVNGAGLSTAASQVVDLTDPPPPAMTGEIAGTVMEGERLQPNLPVVLFDDKGMQKAQTQTDANGRFRFEKLAPGSYRVSAAKAASQTKGEAKATVEAGKTKEVMIELFR
jgi:hypothetical protein